MKLIQPRGFFFSIPAARRRAASAVTVGMLVAASLTPLPGLSSGGTSQDSVKEEIKWRTLAAGEAEAKRTGKPVLYFLTAEWCGPCHLMKRAVFADPKMAELIHTQFVPIEVVDKIRETGRNPEEVNQVFRRFQLRGFPTLAVARPQTGPAVIAAGWGGRERANDFLAQARELLAQKEATK